MQISSTSRTQAGKSITGGLSHQKRSIFVKSVISIDVEEWFHILKSPAAPGCETWGSLESRVHESMDRILELLDDNGICGTFFWLGWVAERHKSLLRRCSDAGHEIASHGYHHVMPSQVGSDRFRDDIDRAKKFLEDATGKQVRGFRVAGFGIKSDMKWVFDLIKVVGHEYDSSVFPSWRNHAEMHNSHFKPYPIHTKAGPLVEIPMSAVNLLGFNLFFFGGGYLRLAPIRLVKWGIGRLHKSGSPLIVYIHPREIDVDGPRLPLSMIRRFKCYVNLKKTMSKLAWICRTCEFLTMSELAGKLSEHKD